MLSVLEDKDAAEMLRALLPSFDRVVLTRCSNPRSLSPGTLDALAGKLAGPPVETVADAARRARACARAGRPGRRGAGHRLDLPGGGPGAGRGRRARLEHVSGRRPQAPLRHHCGLMDGGEGPSFVAMIALVAVVVATVILVFFGIGYGLGRLFL